MTAPLPADRYRKLPITEVTTPHTGHYNVYTDYWWAVTDDDCVILYGLSKHRRNSPQCNADPHVTEMVRAKLQYPWPTTIRQIPAVYLPMNPMDYA